MSVNEAHLLQLARQGSPAACSELFDGHYDAIYRYCYCHVGNTGLAQDLANQVLVQMVENLDTLAGHGRPLRTWLYAIAHNLIASSLDEPHLVQLARQGDPEGCFTLYDRYYDAIYRYCYFYVGDATSAQDLTSQVFVQMVNRLDGFKEHDQPLLAGLYAIARRVIAGHYRQRGQKLPPSLEDTAAVDRNIASHSAQGLSAENLAIALNYMTDQDRQVILFQFVEDHSCAEAAHLMGQSYETFKPQPHRALTALQCALSCVQ